MLEQTETQVAYRPVSGIMAEISGVHKGRKKSRVNHPFPASLSSSVWSHWWLVSYHAHSTESNTALLGY